MHFVKYVDKSSIDPRCVNYYVYQCNQCDHEHFYTWQKNFDTVRLRSCPKCNITNDLNDIEVLTKRSKYLREQIEILSKECEEIQAKLEIIQMIGNSSEISNGVMK